MKRRAKAEKKKVDDTHDEEDDDESASVRERPTKRTKRETNDNLEMEEGEEENEVEGEEEKDESMEDEKTTKKKKKEKIESNRRSTRQKVAPSITLTMDQSAALLNSISLLAYSHLFCAPLSPRLHSNSKKKANLHSWRQKKKAAATPIKQSKRSPLSIMLVHSVCDFLHVASLVTLAKVSRAGYATVRDFGESVVLAESKRSCLSDPFGDDIEFIGSVAGPVNPRPAHRLGYRTLRQDTDDAICVRASTLTLYTSRLRHIVISVCMCAPKLDLNHVTFVARALPYLRVLFMPKVRTKRSTRRIELPSHLRSLSLSLKPHGNVATVSGYLGNLSTAIGSLQYLNEFRLDSYEGFARKDWLPSISRAPRLRHLHTTIEKFITTRETLCQFSSLTSFEPKNLDDSHLWKSLVAIPTKEAKDNDVMMTTSSLPPLRNFDCLHPLLECYLPILLTLSSTLTSMDCGGWSTNNIRWLNSFTQLRMFTFTIKGTDHTEDLTRALSGFTRLTKLDLQAPQLDSTQFERIMNALIALEHLTIRSKVITTIACFSQLSNLAHQLSSLTMQLPKVPRDEVVHLYSLKWLSLLDIGGSFSEPLFARQVMPLNLPSTQLPYLRQFLRSRNEPVPPEPMDLAVQERQRIEFNERVCLGQVSVAERMNMDLLCLILQQLNINEFIFSARTCRSWRSAASLKNAWPSGNTGRILVLEGNAFECLPSILPHLPLWRYARRIHFYVDHRPASSFSSGYGAHSPHLPLSGIAELSRLESFHYHGLVYASKYSPRLLQALCKFLGKVASRLIYLKVDNLYITPLGESKWGAHRFTRLTELDWSPFQYSLTVPNWTDLPALHSLKTNVITKESGEWIRRLSIEHQLHRVALVGPCNEMWSEFLPGLIGSSASLIQVLHFTHPVHHTKSLDLLFHLSQLRDLRVEVEGSNTKWNFVLLPKMDAFQLLRRFDYSGPIDPTQLVHLAHLKELRSFTLSDRSHMYTTTVGLRTWTQPNRNALPPECLTQWCAGWTKLEEFNLKGIQVIGSELKEFTRQVVAKSLRSFQLYHVSTTPLSHQDFSFLSSCPYLESIELVCILGLTLEPRNWFKETGTDTYATDTYGTLNSYDRDGDTKMMMMMVQTAAAAALPAADSTPRAAVTSSSPHSSSSLISILSSCSQLSHLTWCLHPRELDASVDYTRLHYRFGRSITDRREREWARERLALKTRLLQLPSVSLPVTSYTLVATYPLISHRVLSIRYMSCCENIPKLQRNNQLQDHQLTTAEERLLIDSCMSLDEKDDDFIAQQKENERKANTKRTGTLDGKEE